MQRTFGRSASLAALLLIATLLGCGPASSIDTDPTVDSGGSDYLRGVATEWSVPLAELGDASQFAHDSSMRHALVAGDATLFVATSAFRVEHTVALDLIVINHRSEPVRLAAEDIHLFDATGRRLPAKASAPRAAERGLQGRNFARTAPSTLSQDLGDNGLQRDLALTELQAGIGSSAKASAAATARQNRALSTPNISGVETTRPTVDSVVSSVKVDPDEGRPVWAYFEARDLQFPVTAWITLETGEQLRYQFDR